MARLYNAAITHTDAALYPLVNSRNEAVALFLHTLRELSSLHSEG